MNHSTNNSNYDCSLRMTSEENSCILAAIKILYLRFKNGACSATDIHAAIPLQDLKKVTSLMLQHANKGLISVKA
jgi:hypothetical protein